MNDMADPTPSALATLQSETALPIDPTDSTLPTDPIESTDPRLAMLRNESSDAMDHLDDMPQVCRDVGSLTARERALKPHIPARTGGCRHHRP